MGHFENLTLLYPSGATGHQTSAQVPSPWMESPLYSNVSAFKGPLLNEALLLQYDNFLGGPLSYA